MKSLFVFLFSIFVFNSANASLILRSEGAIHGGQARSKGFSLKDVRLEVSPKSKFERISFEIGDQSLKKNIGSPGYFHVENNPQAKTITINFSQTLASAIDLKQIRKKLEKSYFVKSSEMFVDNKSQTTKLILGLIQPVSLRVSPIDGTKNVASAVKLDLFDDNLLKRKK